MLLPLNLPAALTTSALIAAHVAPGLAPSLGLLQAHRRATSAARPIAGMPHLLRIGPSTSFVTPSILRPPPPQWPLHLPSVDLAPLPAVFALSAAVLVFAAVRVVLNYAIAVAQARLVQQQIVVELRTSIYEKLHALSSGFFSRLFHDVDHQSRHERCPSRAAIRRGDDPAIGDPRALNGRVFGVHAAHSSRAVPRVPGHHARPVGRRLDLLPRRTSGLRTEPPTDRPPDAGLD